MSEEGKKLELNLKDNVATKESFGLEGPTKEQLQTIEKQIILVLLDTKKMLSTAAELYTKLRCFHLVISLEACVKNIDEYLAEYERQKAVSK